MRLGGGIFSVLTFIDSLAKLDKTCADDPRRFYYSFFLIYAFVLTLFALPTLGFGAALVASIVINFVHAYVTSGIATACSAGIAFLVVWRLHA